MTGPARVAFYTRRGCHLCDDARSVVARACRDAGVGWREVDVDAEPALREQYGDMVPVVAVDGRIVGYLRLDPQRLRSALRSRA